MAAMFTLFNILHLIVNMVFLASSGTVSNAGNGAKRSGKIGDRKSRSIYGRGLPKKGKVIVF